MSIKKEQLNSLKGKKIALLGLGIENLSLLKFLLNKRLDCEIIICDSRSEKELRERISFLKKDKIKFSFGKNYDNDLTKYDLIMRSPGYPMFSKNLVKAEKAGVKISSPMKLFFDLCPARIIGVTGTKGKGTTASLIYSVLKLAFRKPDQNRIIRKVFLGGNIGVAPFDFINKLNKNDFVVLELSSFQLEDLHKSAFIAVVVNIFKEHLAPADPNNPNYHKSIAKYWEAKKRIFKYQGGDSHLVANDKLRNKIGHDNRTIFFTKSNLKSRLIGEHNKENVAAAYEVARILGIKKSIIEKAIRGFKGLPHRLDKVAEINGVEYYDDSFATTPEASIIALRSFSKNQTKKNNKNIILLAGGADKGSDFKEFVKEMSKQVKYLILFKGKGTDKIKKEIQNMSSAMIRDSKFKIQNSIVDSMAKAIIIAKKKTKPGDIVLLSTACASFGIFKNYKDRGEQFKKEIKKET